MKTPAIRRSPQHRPARPGERGVTMVLMALAMVAILAMAALSIDVVTLYLANAEAQRSADTAALAAARVLSITGMTGDSSNSASAFTTPWQQACALATSVATAVATQNTMGGVALSTSQISVTYPNNSDTTNCTGLNAEFGVNPLVTVKVQRTDLPTFFARIWGRTGASVSATATAESFNSSNSGNVGHTVTGKITPVQPRCVKPWIVPNQDPGNAGTCGGGPGGPCTPLVDKLDGSIQSQGIMINNTPPGIIGRTFDLFADCKPGGGSCTTGAGLAQDPRANVTGSVGTPNLQYVPGDLPASFTAVPSCATGSNFQEAIAGCDQTTLYQCGNDDQPSTVDLGQNGVKSDSVVGGQCLIRATGDGPGMGQDSLDPSLYPYKIKAGSANLLGVSSGSIITSSNSIVSFPIYDNTTTIAGKGTSPQVIIIGFLQVFINSVNTGNNSVNVTVLNVAGCGNGTNPTANTAVTGTSPVPVRLIKYP
jgi:Flp pilus assembly protein TadG